MNFAKASQNDKLKETKSIHFQNTCFNQTVILGEPNKTYDAETRPAIFELPPVEPKKNNFEEKNFQKLSGPPETTL